MHQKDINLKYLLEEESSILVKMLWICKHQMNWESSKVKNS